MKIKSFYSSHNQLIPLEVEVTLWPGLPQLHFLGLADQHLKESAMRIKSAIKSSGYQWPKASEILINLKPSFVKKSSRGLELAVAYAILRATHQVPESQDIENAFIYGELSLSGEVTSLTDSCLLSEGESLLEIPHLENFKINNCAVITPDPVKWTRPQNFQNFLFSNQQAEILKLIAFGEHSALLAGPSGSGKTTIVDCLPELLREPNNKTKFSIAKNQNYFGQKISWVPVVKPHHTIPIHSMIGGGNSPVAGEISRAHGGVLVMDEMLEFNSQVLESLREPMQEKRISVARAGKVSSFPAESIYLGTTNLCPCGDYTPNNHQRTQCHYSLAKCRSYSHRFTGPFLDRFELLIFLEPNQKPEVPAENILEDLLKIYTSRQSSQKLTLEDLEGLLSPRLRPPGVLPQFASQRRRLATLKVAHTISALEGRNSIDELSLKKALKWTLHSFEKLKRWEV